MRVPFIIPDGGGFVKLDAGWIFRYHGPDDEVMTMQYLCAPMEGVTGDLFRQAQRQTFPAADSYYTPFLSPTANRTFSPRELREIEPAHNAGIRVVPQLMGHCAEDFLWMRRPRWKRCAPPPRQSWSTTARRMPCAKSCDPF